MTRNTITTACLALTLTLLSVGSQAEPVAPVWRAAWVDAPTLQLAQASGSISADRAAAIAAEATGGRVLSVDRQAGDDGVVYRVKVLMSDGRVRVIRIDGASGRIKG